MLPIDCSVYAHRLRLLPAVLLLLLAAPVAAQEWAQHAHGLPAAQRAHLWRVAVWGAANVAVGATLLTASDRRLQPARHGFGLQSAAWGAINVGIAAVGLAAGAGDRPLSLAGAIRAENGYADVLLLNIGLNVGYAGVGAALLAVAHRAGVASAETRGALRGHGWALVLQGAGLLVLDGAALLGSRTRLGVLLDLVGGAVLAVGPAGIALHLPL